MNNQKTITPIILVFYVKIDKSISREHTNAMYINLRNNLDRLHYGKNIESFIFMTYEESRVECINPVFIDKKKHYSQIKNILKNAEKSINEFCLEDIELYKFHNCQLCKHNYDGKWVCQDCENSSKFAKMNNEQIYIEEPEDSTISCVNCSSFNYNDKFGDKNCETCVKNSNFKQKE